MPNSIEICCRISIEFTFILTTLCSKYRIYPSKQSMNHNTPPFIKEIYQVWIYHSVTFTGHSM